MLNARGLVLPYNYDTHDREALLQELRCAVRVLTLQQHDMNKRHFASMSSNLTVTEAWQLMGPCKFFVAARCSKRIAVAHSRLFVDTVPTIIELDCGSVVTLTPSIGCNEPS